jgi:uncharacterized protein YyaL (SSP411 family)
VPNRLTNATSPYLLQHADNPVDWYEWGEEAFSLARATDRPVLLSVGYSACHWCHVMAHESFEDDTTAAYMNENFVNVKVDREERPDIDRIYMDAVQAMTGQGGWPMTVFLTPEGGPFFAGTYYPREPRGPYPTFMQVLTGIAAAWNEQRGQLTSQAAKLTAAVQANIPAASAPPGRNLIPRAITHLEARFDARRGGFGGAPKFPQAPTLELLLRVAASWPETSLRDRSLAMLTKTLDEMAAGGIYDHLYGGFARYSVDAEWLVPHFEKMLYDNSLLARVYTHAWRITGNDEYRRVAIETLDYLVQEMRDESGGIFSAEDADSEGEEGKFAIWSFEEFSEVVGEDVGLMAAIYGVTPDGNFEGSSILERYRSLDDVGAEYGLSVEDLTARRALADGRLIHRRRTRVPPSVDDKVVVAWNGLALRAFAEAGVALGRPDYIDVAVGIAEFTATHGTTPDGRLVRSWRDGRISGPAFCDDYAAVAVGLFALHQATGDAHWYQEAIHLTDEMIRLFADPAGGAFFAVGVDSADLIARPKNLMDNPTPSDNSLAAEALAIRAAYTGETHLAERVSAIAQAAGTLPAEHPMAVGYLLSLLAVSPLRQVAIVAGDDGSAEHLVAVFNSTFRPDHVLAVDAAAAGGIPLLDQRYPIDGKAAAYVCEGFVCRLPTTDPAELTRQLEAPRTEPAE